FAQDIPDAATKSFLQKEGIKDIMFRVADWQLAHPRREISPIDWHYGAFYTGLRALYELTGERQYLDKLLRIGQTHHWRPLDDFFNADRLTVTDNWAWLYGLSGDSIMIEKSRWIMDAHLARNYKELTDVHFQDNPYRLEWWTWCDALFMAPPSFVQMWKVTGEDKYLQYMDAQWWKTSDYLYSPEDSLYYRDDRYFEKRSDNGTKIFWARGNGWVIAGLARLLTNLPEDYRNREKFEQQYREMAHKLLRIQGEDGLWRVSLLDPAYLDIGESSGSSFFTFALAWGINRGLIDKKYGPQVEKAWAALCANVNAEGRLGFVQQVAGDPYPFYADQSHVYASGAFLLAGRQVYEMVDKEGRK
ncbi:MAG: glycoside hydrolase family 88 protein, partial [Phaeodactylibacter sp.]|nr:glycoside hydrolase family 88 protein [Phaeodactylibacter sp.]